MLKFYDEKYLASKLGIERRKFHREIKPIIVSDFKNELQKFKVENPDIGLDENDNIYFLDPKDHSRMIETNLSIFAYH